MAIEDYHNLAYWGDDDPAANEPTEGKVYNKMAELWKPQPKEVLQHWIDSLINEASDDLTDWETNFIDNIDSLLKSRESLSQRQQEILERIYAEKTK